MIRITPESNSSTASIFPGERRRWGSRGRGSAKRTLGVKLWRLRVIYQGRTGGRATVWPWRGGTYGGVLLSSGGWGRTSMRPNTRQAVLYQHWLDKGDVSTLNWRICIFEIDLFSSLQYLSVWFTCCYSWRFITEWVYTSPFCNQFKYTVVLLFKTLGRVS